MILLLNSSELQGTDGSAFGTFLEKVVDRTLEFLPTSKECAEIAFDNDDEVVQQVARHVVALGISNIRVMRKIEYAAKQLHAVLKEYDAEVFRRACQSMIPLAWSHYQPTVAPTMEYLTVKKASGFFGITTETNWTPEEANWNTLLDAYGYLRTDEFDLSILGGVQSGYFDPETMATYAQPMHEEIVTGIEMNFLQRAWNTFYNSFANNEEEVLDTISKEFRQRVHRIPLSSLNNVVELFKNIGNPEQGADLLDFYISKREEPAEFWNLDTHPFGGLVSDLDVRDAIGNKYRAFQKVVLDPADMIRKLMERDSFDVVAIEGLATTPMEEYYQIFKSIEGDELPRMIEAVFKFRRISNPSAEMNELMRKATEALTVIGSESRINATRVARYGIKIERSNATPASCSEGTPA